MSLARFVIFFEILSFQREYLSDFANSIALNTFSLLPAPLHVAYRDKDEDDDLEKAYKEVCVDFLSAMLDFTFACFQWWIATQSICEARNLIVFLLVKGFCC